MPTDYEKFIKRVREINTIESVSGFLGWDQETIMPAKGGKARAEALACLSSLGHAKITDPELGKLLAKLESTELAPEQAANVRETRREYEKATKLPIELVEELARSRSLAQQVWQEARERRDFGHFEKTLKNMVALTRKVAECYGYEKEPYDALLDIYEPELTATQVEPMFAGLKKRIVPLVLAISEVGGDRATLAGTFPQKDQHELGRFIARELGFDFGAGRMDISTHPFTSGMNPCDVRFTTRYNEAEPFSSLYATIHETGHALYEQGLQEEHLATPMGAAVSLGIHESQSRTWENVIGRGRPFADYLIPHFQKAFPHLPGDFGAEHLFKAVNQVKPSLIRVEADEVTYNLHILMRFEIERELMNGGLDIAELPGLWDAKLEEYLGVTPPDVAQGVLQDIHWSMGYIGYFPTYTLGNLYGAQFMESARKALPDLDGQIAKGRFAALLDWQRENIHCHGKLYRPRELVKKVTGSEPTSEPFLRYLKEKFEPLYGL